MWLVLGLGFCTGGEGQGRPSGTLFTSCFFTDEVGEREMGESPSSSQWVEAATARSFLNGFVLAWS